MSFLLTQGPVETCPPIKTVLIYLGRKIKGPDLQANDNDW